MSVDEAEGRKDDAGGNVSGPRNDPAYKECLCGWSFVTIEGRMSPRDGILHRWDECVRAGISGSSLNAVGRKDDAGKLPYDLLPWGAVAQVVAVLQYGAKEYAPDNWKQVKDWRRRYFSAACRHLISWVTGEKLDPETGLHHLAHASCCLLFMIELDK